MSKRHTIDDIINLILSNDQAVDRAITALYLRHQNLQQSANKETFLADREVNDVSYWYGWIRSGKHLTGHHLAHARLFAIKHRRILFLLAQEAEEIGAVTLAANTALKLKHEKEQTEAATSDQSKSCDS